jgi:hypothetical protein
MTFYGVTLLSLPPKKSLKKKCIGGIPAKGHPQK